MEITLETIEKRNDPYQLFLDHFKNNETRRKYDKIKAKIEKIIESWDSLLKQPTKLKNWYAKWIHEILKFQKQNTVLIGNMSEFSIG